MDDRQEDRRTTGFGSRNGSRSGVTVDLAQLFGRMPPAAREAEMSLLGAMILDPAVTSEVLQHIRTAESFSFEPHKSIFEALVRHYDAHHAGDLAILIETLRDRGTLEDVGGPEYLVRLAESAPSAVNAPHYARLVAEKYKLRRLIEAAGQIVYDAYHAGELDEGGAHAVLDKAERLVFDIAEEAQVGAAQRLNELLHETMEMLEANEGRTILGIASGYADLDEMTTGFQPGELIIIAARPSMGKTALALNLAENIALRGGPGAAPAPIVFFSLEMSRQALTQRLMCSRSGVDSQRLRRNMLSDLDYQRLMGACGELSEAPLYIDDTPGMTIMQLRARARRLSAQRGIKCIVVDYLQLLTAPGSSRESRQVEVSAISRGIKALARELNAPIVCLSQLNRSAEQREGHRPRMSDLRESGSIEQDADVIMLLHREAYYHAGDPDWAADNADREHTTELLIAKQRNGPTGVVELEWDAKTTRFNQREWRTAAPPTKVIATPAAADAPSFRPGGAFASRPKTGPAVNHRDGGGESAPFDEDIDDLPI